LLGHLLELCNASDAGAALDFARIPLHPGVMELARAGLVTGASARNWSGYGAQVDRGTLHDAELAVLTDPQTSGGLLAAVAPEDVDAVLRIFDEEGFGHAAVIGSVVPAAQPRVIVR
jgi:selenide,water dikinase